MNGPLVSAEVVGEDDYVTRMCASEGSLSLEPAIRHVLEYREGEHDRRLVEVQPRTFSAAGYFVTLHAKFRAKLQAYPLEENTMAIVVSAIK